jgi:phosphoribosylamine--glycine ligase
MAEEGHIYTGCLYMGLMIHEGEPTVVEYNCRFGDPETQSVVALLDGSFYSLLHQGACGKLKGVRAKQRSGSAACVVLTSGGYPGSYEVDKEIFGLEDAGKMRNLYVFHAGTRLTEGGHIVTSGGRVLGITGVGSDIKDAVKNAYSGAERISFEGCHYRTDIGYRAVKRIEKQDDLKEGD